MAIVKETDVAIVGSGPGGATVARQLAWSAAGLGVTLLERGRDWRRHPLYGTYPGGLLYTDKHSLLFTREGLNIIRPLMLGGATSMYCGCAARPLPWWNDKYNINLDAYAGETIAELGIAPLPLAERGTASTRIAEAALELGMPWFPQDKFIWPERSHRFDCGAKWNAAEYVDTAVAEGCDLWTRAKVERVLIEDGLAAGVQGKVNGKPFTIQAPIVILAAGGIGAPRHFAAQRPAGRPARDDDGYDSDGLRPRAVQGRRARAADELELRRR